MMYKELLIKIDGMGPFNIMILYNKLVLQAYCSPVRHPNAIIIVLHILYNLHYYYNIIIVGLR